MQFGDEGSQRVELLVRLQRPAQRPDLVVDAEPGQVGVRDVVEQFHLGGRGARVQLAQALGRGLERDVISDLDAAADLVLRDAPVARPLLGLVVWKHAEQQVADLLVVRSDDHPAPEVGDPDGADPWITGTGDLLQVQSGVGVLAELRENLIYPLLYGFLQLGVLGQEVSVQTKGGHAHSSVRGERSSGIVDDVATMASARGVHH